MLRLIIFNLLISILFLATAFSQSKSLKFIKVKLITTTTETVPANKVWKVEGIFTDVTSTGNFSSTDTPAILVNGVKNYYIVPMPIGSGTSFAVVPAGFPLWLPSGTSLAASNKVKYVNVIEFEITQ